MLPARLKLSIKVFVGQISVMIGNRQYLTETKICESSGTCRRYKYALLYRLAKRTLKIDSTTKDHLTVKPYQALRL